MLHGSFALLERSLRTSARSLWPHLARLGLLIAIALQLLFTSSMGPNYSAPGLRFFYGIACLDAVFMTLFGIGFFSSSITEEKEEDTLGLIMLAGVSPVGILAGKSAGRLWEALLLIAVQFPLVQLAATMGGVLPIQIWYATIALMAYLIFLSGWGLLCSTLAPNGRTASFWMGLGVFVYAVIPSLVADWLIRTSLLMRGSTASHPAGAWKFVLEGIAGISVFTELSQILSTGFPNTLFSIQVVSNVVIGLLCAGISWLCFGIATRSPAAESSSRLRVFSLLSNKGRLVGTPWGNPFVWKDFYFASGGIRGLVLRTVYYAVLGTLVVGLAEIPSGGMMIFLMVLSMLIDISNLVSRSLQAEVQHQTLPSLAMLPHSLEYVLYSKIGGALLGWLPAPLVGGMTVLMTPSLREATGSILSSGDSGLAIIALASLFFALIPHLAALLSVYVRWGAVPMAFGLAFAVYTLISLISVVLFMNAGGPGTGEAIVFCTCFCLFLCSVACHFGVIFRVLALIEK